MLAPQSQGNGCAGREPLIFPEVERKGRGNLGGWCARGDHALGDDSLKTAPKLSPQVAVIFCLSRWSKVRMGSQEGRTREQQGQTDSEQAGSLSTVLP